MLATLHVMIGNKMITPIIKIIFNIINYYFTLWCILFWYLIYYTSV